MSNSEKKLVLLERLLECKLLYIYNQRWQIALLIFIPGFRIPERSYLAATSVYNPFNKNIIIYSNVYYIQYITVLNNSSPVNNVGGTHTVWVIILSQGKNLSLNFFFESWEFLGIWESHGNGNIPMGMSGNGNGNLFGNFAIFPKSWEFWEWEWNPWEWEFPRFGHLCLQLKKLLTHRMFK